MIGARWRVRVCSVYVPVFLIVCVCLISGCATTQGPAIASLDRPAYVPAIAASDLKLPQRKGTLARRERSASEKVKG